MTTQEIIAQMRRELQGTADAGEVQAMTSMVVEHVLHYSPVDVVLRADFEQPEVLVQRIMAMTERLRAHEPVQYVLGTARFQGMDFRVTRATLIPRPETERLVDIIVDEHRDEADLRVMDVGTGSGCIAVSLARALRWSQVTATDVSAEALQVAADNAQRLKARVTFRREDMTRAVAPSETLDIVVSNPPYVCESERAQMEPNVLRYEPAGALYVPDDDPLRYYVPLARYAHKALKPGGSLYLEINRRFGRQVAQLLEQQGLQEAQVLKDQFGADRFVTARKPAQ